LPAVQPDHIEPILWKYLGTDVLDEFPDVLPTEISMQLWQSLLPIQSSLLALHTPFLQGQCLLCQKLFVRLLTRKFNWFHNPAFHLTHNDNILIKQNDCNNPLMILISPNKTNPQNTVFANYLGSSERMTKLPWLACS